MTDHKTLAFEPAFYVRTKFLGPTNCRPSRVKASTASGVSVTLEWDHALNMTANHERAFAALLDRAGREARGDILVNGGLADGYVFMCETNAL